MMSNNLSIYSIHLSNVPGLSFLYVDNEKYSRIEDVSPKDQDLLRAFEHGTIGSKRRNCVLTHREQNTFNISVNVTVLDSTLFTLNHQSDVIAKVPNCKINFMNICNKLFNLLEYHSFS